MRDLSTNLRGCSWFMALATVLAGACSSAEPEMVAGGRVCVGTAVACAVLSGAECATAQGCTAGVCSGDVGPCSRSTTSSSCTLQQGCSWDEALGACDGKPVACAAYGTAASCGGNRGCGWSAGCAGKPVDCGALSESACGAQAGCHVSVSGLAKDEVDAAPEQTWRPVCKAPPPADEVIDDMEDMTAEISSTSYYGQWFVYNDATIGGRQKPAPGSPVTMEPIPEPRCGSNYAMRLTGSGFTEWGAGMGFNFAFGAKLPDQESSPAVPFDGSPYDGVRFWARVGASATATLRFSLIDKNTHPDGHVCTMAQATPMPRSDGGSAANQSAEGGEGGALDELGSAEDAASRDGGAAEDVATGGHLASSDGGLLAPTLSTANCYNGFGRQLTLTTEWTEYRVSFSQLAQQPGWGYRAPAFTRDQIYAVQFDVPSGATFDVWIDDISWFHASEP